MTGVVRLLRVDPASGGAPHAPLDPARVLAGAPLSATGNVYSSARGNFHCGVWASSAGRWSIRYTEDEFCYLIEGAAVITDATGHAETVRAGDAFVIPAGFSGSWETLGNARKFYAICEEP